MMSSCSALHYTTKTRITGIMTKIRFSSLTFAYLLVTISQVGALPQEQELPRLDKLSRL